MTDRRTVLTTLAGGLAVATGGVAAVAASTGADHPDAALLALAERCIEVHKEWNDENRSDAEMENFSDEVVDPVMTAISETSALTARGLAAKVTALRQDGMNEEGGWDCSVYGQLIIASLFEDIDRMAGKAVTHG